MDEYVIVEKSSLKSMADTIRDTLGSTDSIAVTDLGVKLIESIEAGGGGDVFISTFTPATNVNSYTVANPIGGTTLGILAIANNFGTILGTRKGIAIAYGNSNIGNRRRGYMCELNGSFKVSIPYVSAGGEVINSITNDTIELAGGHYNSVFVAGVTYTCVIAKDGVMI